MEVRRVGMRQLQRFFYKELKNIPLIITKGKPGRGNQSEDVMVILPYRKELLNSEWISDLDIVTDTKKNKGFLSKIFHK